MTTWTVVTTEETSLDITQFLFRKRRRLSRPACVFVVRCTCLLPETPSLIHFHLDNAQFKNTMLLRSSGRSWTTPFINWFASSSCNDGISDARYISHPRPVHELRMVRTDRAAGDPSADSGLTALPETRRPTPDWPRCRRPVGRVRTDRAAGDPSAESGLTALPETRRPSSDWPRSACRSFVCGALHYGSASWQATLWSNASVASLSNPRLRIIALLWNRPQRRL
jgi:hypothetical protein